ncbi:glycosyltransferase family 2 protein [Pseudophaeobacter sp.]|uniref:glycosyltransferase family 2 protein n=1 Tax=Pseudophaeobacter sp. TaxID=1971739 RepID=UPI0032972174
MTDHPSQPSLLARLKNRLLPLFQQLRFLASLRHLQGPRRRVAAPDEVVLVTLVRDGAFYLDAFFDHYRALGVAHFVFFDNGSSDATLAQLQEQPGVSVLQSRLPWGAYENIFRSYAARCFAQDRWCLIVDMDEIFDFEGRAEIGLPGLTRYLTRQGYTGLMAQMLEMFPKAPLRAVANLPYRSVLEQFDHCDISTVTSYDYQSTKSGLAYFLIQNRATPPAPQILFGGVRGKVFGEDCCLSKHPLIFVGPAVTPALHPHASTGLTLAPMSALIRHYKFANDALARDRASVAAASIAHGEDQQRLSVLQQQPDLSLWSPEAQPFPGITALQEQAFLQADPACTACLADLAQESIDD